MQMFQRWGDSICFLSAASSNTTALEPAQRHNLSSVSRASSFVDLPKTPQLSSFCMMSSSDTFVEESHFCSLCPQSYPLSLPASQGHRNVWPADLQINLHPQISLFLKVLILICLLHAQLQTGLVWEGGHCWPKPRDNEALQHHKFDIVFIVLLLKKACNSPFLSLSRSPDLQTSCPIWSHPHARVSLLFNRYPRRSSQL